MCVESSPRYENAKRLYLRQGFELKIQIEDYFEDGDSLSVYAKEL
jgi:ribosomal protein S18 acetylase RimI-like enzyme